MIGQTLKTAPPDGGHVFHRTETTFELNQHIIKANILTQFYENWAKNLTSRVENAPPTGGHISIKPFFFTKVHDDWAKIVTSRVFTRKTGRTGTGTTFELNKHIIKANILTHFKLDRDIIRTNLLTKNHDDRAINVASRVFTN
ncbi:hypothetical protein DPMN_182494 [Dreissena polymorpha]|uniref:Uncharacterized protein n=1 Tax=Dreissena polymorpha TaxID=45954 RepID=A0A9D4DH99_DREPO|nr:hypothetical protein DPMN_182494 [Dreissena polymorpha]